MSSAAMYPTPGARNGVLLLSIDNAPLEPMLNIATARPSAGNATARKRPSGDTFIPAGDAGSVAVRPLDESDPSAAMLRTTILFVACRPANKNCPLGEASSDTSPQPAPVDTADPAAVKAPEFGSMENALTLPLPPFDANRWVLDVTTRLTA